MGMTEGMVVACAVVGIILGLITAIMGITSAASTAQTLVLTDDGVLCEYQGSPAVGCGVMAALLALTTQIVATAATGCCGCCRTWGIPTEARRIVTVVLSTISWVLAIIVVILFMVGAIFSRDRGLPVNATGICVPPGTGVFVAATILFLISMVCQITSYILLQATTVAGSTKPSLVQESGITIGKPPAAEPANNAAAAGDLPPSAPTAAAAGDVPPSAPTAAAAGDLPPSAPTAAAAGDVPPSAPTAAAAGDLPPSAPTAAAAGDVPPSAPTAAAAGDLPPSAPTAAAAGDVPPSAPTAAAAGDLPPSAPTAAAAGDLPPSAPTAAAAGDLPPSAPTAAAAGDLPHSVPTASSEANVDTPPSAPTMSPKADADLTSHV